MSKPSIPIPDPSEASAEDVEAFYDVVARMTESERRGFSATLEQGRELERDRVNNVWSKHVKDAHRVAHQKAMWGE